jgi:hypothetical protein
MKTKNRNYLGSWEYGKWQLYGRAVETVQTARSLAGRRFSELYFNQDGIKRGGVAQVGKFFRGEHIHVSGFPSSIWPKATWRRPHPSAQQHRLEVATSPRRLNTRTRSPSAILRACASATFISSRPASSICWGHCRKSNSRSCPPCVPAVPAETPGPAGGVAIPEGSECHHRVQTLRFDFLTVKFSLPAGRVEIPLGKRQIKI